MVPIFDILSRSYRLDQTDGPCAQGCTKIASRMMSPRSELLLLPDWAFGLVLSAESAHAVQTSVDEELS